MSEITQKVRFLYYMCLHSWPHDIKEEISMCCVAANYGLYGGKHGLEASTEFKNKIVNGVVYDLIKHGEPLNQYCWKKKTK
jgi:hypothetical protein